MLRWSVFGVIAASLLAGVGYALWQLPPQPSRLEFRRIEHTARPAHVPAGFLNEVQALGRFPDQVDCREPALLSRLADAFAQHPWVSRVEQVRRVGPSGLAVDLRFRTPVARVVVERGEYFVDGEGVRLPPPHNVGTALVEVRGARRAPSAPAGQRFGDAAVEAAARLAADAAPGRQLLQYNAIVISDDPIEPDLRLATAGGTQIVWQTLHAQPAVKYSVETRLKLLEEYCRQNGSLDRPSGPYLFDVRSGVLLRRALPRASGRNNP